MRLALISLAIFAFIAVGYWALDAYQVPDDDEDDNNMGV